MWLLFKVVLFLIVRLKILILEVIIIILMIKLCGFVFWRVIRNFEGEGRVGGSILVVKIFSIWS